MYGSNASSKLSLNLAADNSLYSFRPKAILSTKDEALKQFKDNLGDESILFNRKSSEYFRANIQVLLALQEEQIALNQETLVTNYQPKLQSSLRSEIKGKNLIWVPYNHGAFAGEGRMGQIKELIDEVINLNPGKEIILAHENVDNPEKITKLDQLINYDYKKNPKNYKITKEERLAIAFKQDPYLEQFRYFMKLLDQYRSSGCDIRFVSIGATPESELITKHVEEKQTKKELNIDYKDLKNLVDLENEFLNSITLKNYRNPVQNLDLLKLQEENPGACILSFIGSLHIDQINTYSELSNDFGVVPIDYPDRQDGYHFSQSPDCKYKNFSPLKQFLIHAFHVMGLKTLDEELNYVDQVAAMGDKDEENFIQNYQDLIKPNKELVISSDYLESTNFNNRLKKAFDLTFNC
ncbi:MAG: hypothetical protein HRT47_13155 [Candidatus Caenarcaniphilales bacterium]|nr:hypothetical protein [Candidatus Caenarcaniphilales bacterium]